MQLHGRSFHAGIVRYCCAGQVVMRGWYLDAVAQRIDYLLVDPDDIASWVGPASVPR